MKELLLYALINMVGSTLSGAAGGGGSLIGVPVLILMGLSPVTAIGSTKFQVLGLALGGSARFYREKLVDRRSAVIFTLIGLVGSVTGSLFLVHLGRSHQALLQHLTGLIILFIGIPFLYIRNLGVNPVVRSKMTRGVGYIVLLIVAALSGSFSTGMGALQTVVLMSFFGLPALRASATRRIMQLVTATAALIILLLAGIPNLQFGFVALITGLLGGYLGAHIAIKKGNKFVINLFATTSALLALQLLWS